MNHSHSLSLLRNGNGRSRHIMYPKITGAFRNARPGRPITITTVTHSVKTCFRFDDEDSEDDGDGDADADGEDDVGRTINRMHKRNKQALVTCFNKLYYNCQTMENCCGEDLVDWMKRKWGKVHVMELVRINGEMNLRVYRDELSVIDENSTSPVGDFYDDIAHRLNDCLRMDYVKYQLLTKLNTFKRGTKAHLDIPLSIYYDGTM